MLILRENEFGQEISTGGCTGTGNAKRHFSQSHGDGLKTKGNEEGIQYIYVKLNKTVHLEGSPMTSLYFVTPDTWRIEWCYPQEKEGIPTYVYLHHR